MNVFFFFSSVEHNQSFSYGGANGDHSFIFHMAIGDKDAKVHVQKLFKGPLS